MLPSTLYLPCCRLSFMSVVVFLHDTQGDATYLMVTEENKIQDYGLVATCTHLGCIVPWNAAENQFICPCHNSHYDPAGKACYTYVVSGCTLPPFPISSLLRAERKLFTAILYFSRRIGCRLEPTTTANVSVSCTIVVTRVPSPSILSFLPEQGGAYCSEACSSTVGRLIKTTHALRSSSRCLEV